MVEELHTEDGADSSAETTIYKELFFWDPSFLSLCLVFVDPSDDEGEDVDGDKIEYKEFHDGDWWT